MDTTFQGDAAIVVAEEKKRVYSKCDFEWRKVKSVEQNSSPIFSSLPFVSPFVRSFVFWRAIDISDL